MPVRTPKPGDLDRIETASRDELAGLQLQRLKMTLTRVYEHVPHYRQAFVAKGVHPNDLKSIEDLAKFPFTTKKDLRDGRLLGNDQGLGHSWSSIRFCFSAGSLRPAASIQSELLAPTPTRAHP